MTQFAVFYRARQTLRARNNEATTDWSHDWTMITLPVVYQKATFKERITEALTEYLDDQLNDYEVEITSITVLP